MRSPFERWVAGPVPCEETEDCAHEIVLLSFSGRGRSQCGRIGPGPHRGSMQHVPVARSSLHRAAVQKTVIFNFLIPTPAATASANRQTRGFDEPFDLSCVAVS